MLKHASIPPKSATEEEKDKNSESEDAKAAPREQNTFSSLDESTSPAVLRDLLEKNLKWSQIIYEQNRKINHKLLWSAVANWLRLFVLLVPFILAIIFLPPYVRDFKDKYGRWLQAAESGKLTPSNINDLLNLLPVNSAERDRINAMLK